MTEPIPALAPARTHEPTLGSNVGGGYPPKARAGDQTSGPGKYPLQRGTERFLDLPGGRLQDAELMRSLFNLKPLPFLYAVEFMRGCGDDAGMSFKASPQA
jgi:hypothetical protein